MTDGLKALTHVFLNGTTAQPRGPTALRYRNPQQATERRQTILDKASQHLAASAALHNAHGASASRHEMWDVFS
jgi:hypothetical protein